MTQLEMFNPIEYLTPNERAVYDLAQHYNMIMRNKRRSTGFYSVSPKNPTEHKNWKYFVKLNNMCIENNWEAKLYIEYAFIHGETYWKRLPTPAQLCAPKIQKSFVIWKEKEDRKYQHSLKQKERKASKTMSLLDEIKNSIKKSIERVEYEMEAYIDSFPSEVSKVIVILDNLDMLSPAYLYAIDYVRNELVHDLNTENKNMLELKQDFLTFSRSKAISNFIMEEVEKQEREKDIPINISLKEFNEYAQKVGE